METVHILNDLFVQNIRRMILQLHNDWMEVKSESMNHDIFYCTRIVL